MARPPARARAAPTPDRLLSAAARAFGRLGFERARLEDIAAEAGITRASLLHHYASKDELYEAVTARAFEGLERTVERALFAPGDFRARLRALVDALVAYEADHRDELALVLRGCLREDDVVARRRVEESLSPLIDRMESFVRFGLGPDVPEALPIRAAILQVIFAQLVRSAMGETGAALWKGDAEPWALSHLLLLGSLPAEPTADPPVQAPSDEET